ncbi:MAG: MraY family glycosyltransferase [candidate division Zixibacteria bacterium]
MEFSGIALAVLLSVGLAALLLPLAIRLGHKYQFLDMPGKHKRHRKPTPMVGGPVLLLVLWPSLLIAGTLFPELFGQLSTSFGYVLAGALIIALVGFSDDLTPLSAWIKLAAQVSAGLVLYLGGLRIDPLTIPFYGPVWLGDYSVIVTLFWVIMLTNAINLLDGLDGLASGVSLVAALVLAIVGFLYDVGAVVLMASTLSGFLAVFLFYNYHPARTFLGDSGSLQIGYYFAVISLLVPIRSYTAAALYLPLLSLALPLLETGTAVVRRVVSGKSIMRADRRHLFHLLALAGLSGRQVVSLFYILSVVFGLFTLAMYYLNRIWVVTILALFMVVIFGAIFILLTNLQPKKRHFSADKPDRNDRLKSESHEHD